MSYEHDPVLTLGERMATSRHRAGLDQLRHWFGTRTLMACDNLRTVQELMGHADPKTTAIYTAFCAESGRAAVHALSLSAA